jgi:cytidine deaminase
LANCAARVYFAAMSQSGPPLDPALVALIAAARAARAQAYAPYSKFPVGAALRGAGGGIFGGANVENAAYPQSQCAEASAIGQMVTAGERRIAALVVIGDQRPCPPCGGCRQRLAEFAGPELPVHLCAPDGTLLQTVTLGALLPLAFGRGHVAPPP